MTSQPTKETIPLNQIPIKLMHGLPSHTITLVGYRENDAHDHCACGTLVKLRDDHFILTAAHCARRLERYDRIAIPIRKGGHPLIVQRMPPIYVGEWKSLELGPDLAFLPIHPVDVGNLNARSNKIFHNLERYKDEILRRGPKVENSLWVIVGTPARLSNVSDPQSPEFRLMAYGVRVKPTITKEGFDYIDVCVPLDGENSLPTFQGLSGGALWQAEIKREKGGSVSLAGPRKLVGCAFYESRALGEYRYIRCHGPRSIYEQGLAKLPNRENE